jgi:tripartite-type tricarboxylate transporter receptor subunit TctC
LVAEQIDLTIIDPTTSLAQVRAGNLKAFAVAAAARLSSAPEIPTVDEAGLPGFYVSSRIVARRTRQGPRLRFELCKSSRRDQ